MNSTKQENFENLVDAADEALEQAAVYWDWYMHYVSVAQQCAQEAAEINPDFDESKYEDIEH